MRTLNDYFLPAGTIQVDSAGNNSDVVAIPDAGQFIGAYINVHVVIGAPDVTFDIRVNNALLSNDLTLPGLTPDETGVFMPTPSPLVYVQAGDALHIQANGEQVAVTTGDLIFVIRR